VIRPGRQPYRVLLDPSARAEPGAPRIEVAQDSGVHEIVRAVAALFESEPGWAAVTLAVQGEPVGCVSRARFAAISGSAGVDRDTPVGTGDGGTLPGQPTRYDVFAYTCPRCGNRTYVLEADGDPPTCPAGHGAMELSG
jgi:hypothetical protein